MTTKHATSSQTWNISLWIAQVVLAGMFVMAGFIKTFTPIGELTGLMPFAAEMPVLIRFIGMSELAGSLGLILPAAFRISPQLTTVAAGALGVVMALALAFHIARGEFTSIGVNIMLGILAAFIVFGRLNKAPITKRVSGKRTVARN